ncbi:HK97 family phage prohead protease [Faecalibaculum rodentium]|uniref:HK97 family phage prohead protease n=1 Tax=Faecalibaculum rodentium TaxID=1702221 RepID=UPI00273052F3|nr:HK97 family phage prohead protease [Faecalibaculum rodentium]
MEKRILTAPVQLETREDETPVIKGYFAVFDSNYEICDGYTESIDRHAFDDQLNRDVRALVNHDMSRVLGRTTAGTLRLRVDDHGLYGEVSVNPKDTDAMNCYERVKRGDVSQCSFGFDIQEETCDHKDDRTHWTIKALDLYEVSVCTFPAYEATSVSARGDDIRKDKARQLQIWKEKEKKRLKGEDNV